MWYCSRKITFWHGCGHITHTADHMDECSSRITYVNKTSTFVHGRSGHCPTCVAALPAGPTQVRLTDEESFAILKEVYSSCHEPEEHAMFKARLAKAGGIFSKLGGPYWTYWNLDVRLPSSSDTELIIQGIELAAQVTSRQHVDPERRVYVWDVKPEELEAARSALAISLVLVLVVSSIVDSQWNDDLWKGVESWQKGAERDKMLEGRSLHAEAELRQRLREEIKQEIYERSMRPAAAIIAKSHLQSEFEDTDPKTKTNRVAKLLAQRQHLLSEILAEVTRRVPKVKFEKDECCPICQLPDPNIEDESAEHDGDVEMLRCGHRYHLTCIESWFDTGTDTCPLCRRPARVFPQAAPPVPPPVHRRLPEPLTLVNVRVTY